jgi:hypothetical protein
VTLVATNGYNHHRVCTTQVFVGAKRTARWLGLKENGLSPQEKLVRRQEDIKLGFDAFKDWAETQHKNILTKGAIGRALHYAVNQLPLIDPFLEDGRIHLDNNAI